MKVSELITQKNARTTNTIFNFTSSIFGQLITISMQFVTRTVFIYALGKSYLGINGLFSNILSMLSLAEFGVGSAILFKLYDPIAKDDHHRIALLMKFYKKAYTVIGLAVMMIGLCLIPFLPLIISDYDKIVSLHIYPAFIFCIFLLRTVSSYLFFAYKSAIIKANQKEYLINIISYFSTVALAIVQIIVLLVYPNFEIYVILSAVEVIARNIVCARLSDKMFPYINEKTDESISSAEVKSIFKDCGALFLYKLNGVVLKATDNIVLSVFLGLEIVGMYSNYYVLYTTINTLFNKIYNSVSHSLGNLHTTRNFDHEYSVFKTVNLISAILGGTAGIGIYVCSDELVHLWIGDEWILQQPFSLLMGIEIYTLSSRLALSKYRTTMGLFQQAKFRPVAGMLINLIVSVLLVKRWGICGVLVGTIVADWTTLLWYDPIIIHKYGFKKPDMTKSYFIRFIKYTLLCIICGFVDMFLCSRLFLNAGWLSLMIHILICAVTTPLILIFCSFNTQEGKYIFNLGLRYCKKVLKKRN